MKTAKYQPKAAIILLDIVRFIVDSTPRRVSSRDVLDYLVENGTNISFRAVQRNLQNLEKEGCLIKADKSCPVGWRLKHGLSEQDQKRLEALFLIRGEK